LKMLEAPKEPAEELRPESGQNPDEPERRPWWRFW
jgi:hypothetical protein